MTSQGGTFVDAAINGETILCPHYDSDDPAHCKLARPTTVICSGCLVLNGIKCERYEELLLKKAEDATP